MAKLNFYQDRALTIGCEGKIDGFPLEGVKEMTIRLKAGERPEITMVNATHECEVIFDNIEAHIAPKKEERGEGECKVFSNGFSHEIICSSYAIEDEGLVFYNERGVAALFKKWDYFIAGNIVRKKSNR